MVEIEITYGKRYPRTLLTVTGHTVETARKKIIEMFEESEIGGDFEGPWDLSYEDDGAIEFGNGEMDSCICLDDIQKAIKANGTPICLEG